MRRELINEIHQDRFISENVRRARWKGNECKRVVDRRGGMERRESGFKRSGGMTNLLLESACVLSAVPPDGYTCSRIIFHERTWPSK